MLYLYQLPVCMRLVSARLYCSVKPHKALSVAVIYDSKRTLDQQEYHTHSYKIKTLWKHLLYLKKPLTLIKHYKHGSVSESCH